MAVLSIDMGGTKTTAALVDNNFRLLKKQKILTLGKKSRKIVLENLSELIRTYPRVSFHKIAVGFAGILDFDKGRIAYSPHITSLNGFAFKKYLNNKFKKPVFLDNDVNCFVAAEHYFGCAKKFRHVIGLTIGTGIGGGIIVNNKIYRGRSSAGEIGHTIIEPTGPECDCGQRGCLETFVSGPAFARQYWQKTGKKKTPLEIEKESFDKKSVAYAIIRNAAKNLGLVLSNLVKAFDPEIIVLGGSVSRTKTLFPLLKKEVENNLKPLFKPPLILPTALDENAPLLGAAYLARKSKRFG